MSKQKESKHISIWIPESLLKECKIAVLMNSSFKSDSTSDSNTDKKTTKSANKSLSFPKVNNRLKWLK